MRLLLVEDEIKLANAIKRALELQKYAVDVAYDGKIGFDLASGEDFDLIILDVMLPGIDGMELCKRIRKEGKHMPIIMLTAKGQISDKVTGLDNGADDYMIKPFSFEELFARVRALVRRPRKTNKATLQIDDLVLDTVKFTVKRNNKIIKLSTKEFTLLEYLLRNKDRVVTREQVIMHIWNYDADVLPNVVEVHIKHLRDKVDAGHKVRLIQTIRGRGYTIGQEE